MHVVFVSSIGLHGVGGSSDIQRGIVERLVQRGHTVDTVTFAGPATNRAVGKPYRQYTVPTLPVPGASSVLMTLVVLRCVILQRPQLIISGVGYPTAVLVHAVSRLTRLPYAIFTFAEDVTCVGSGSRKARLLAQALDAAQDILTISHFTRAAIMRLGIAAHRIALTPPWVEESAFAPVDEVRLASLRADLGLQHQRVVLTVARLGRRKGHDTVLRAIAGLGEDFADVHYLVVGDGDTTELREIARACGMEGRLTVVAYVSPQDLPLYYHLCNVHAMVSRPDPDTGEVEGFGIVYLEAAAAGKASVAGDAGGAPDAVENGRTGLVVDAHDPAPTRVALARLLSNPDTAQAMGTAAKARASAHFGRAARLDAIEYALLNGWSERLGQLLVR